MSTVIIGGGLTGLFAASLINKLRPKEPITIIEKSYSLGGALKGDLFSEQNFYFDKGTHLFRKTGIVEIDNLIEEINSFDILELSYPEGSYLGAIYNGKLQTNTHYPDLSAEDKNIKKSIKNQILEIALNQDPEIFQASRPAITSSYNRFGKLYTERFLSPILKNLFHLEPTLLSGLAVQMCGLNRLVIDDEIEWKKNIHQTPNYRSLIGIPKQQLIKSTPEGAQSKFYFKDFGTKKLIDNFEKHLKKISNIKILTNQGFDKDPDANIVYLTRPDSNNKEKIFYNNLIITTGVYAASKILRANPEKENYSDTPLLHRSLHIICPEKFDNDLCYFYSYDDNSPIFRVTNYQTFSKKPDDHRLSIEFIGQNEISDDLITQISLDHLHAKNIINKNHVKFKKIIKNPGGFSIPTNKNYQSIINMENEISRKKSDNVLILGIGVGGSDFFQNDVLIRAFQKLKAIY